MSKSKIRKQKEKTSLGLSFCFNNEEEQKSTKLENDISKKSTGFKTQIKGTNQKGFNIKNSFITEFINKPCLNLPEEEEENNNNNSDSYKESIDNNNNSSQIKETNQKGFNDKNSVFFENIDNPCLNLPEGDNNNNNNSDSYKDSINNDNISGFKGMNLKSFLCDKITSFLAYHENSKLDDEHFNTINSIENNIFESKIIGFKDIEKRLEGTEYEFKSNAEIEAREEKIKEDMHKNKNERSKNSADNIHTKAKRLIINYSLLNSMNSTLENKNWGKIKKIK